MNDDLAFSLDARSLKIWNVNDGSPYTAIEPGIILNDLVVYPNTGNNQLATNCIANKINFRSHIYGRRCNQNITVFSSVYWSSTQMVFIFGKHNRRTGRRQCPSRWVVDIYILLNSINNVFCSIWRLQIRHTERIKRSRPVAFVGHKCIASIYARLLYWCSAV